MRVRWKLSIFMSVIVTGLAGCCGYICPNGDALPKQPKADGGCSMSSSIKFELEEAPKGMHNVTLRVTGPNGYNASTYSKKGVPSLDLAGHGKLNDGTYRYEITAASGETVDMDTGLDNGRGDNERKTIQKGISVSGGFEVAEGKIKSKKTDEKEKQ